jgi:NADH:ubiquinone reductase (H+-translocating)
MSTSSGSPSPHVVIVGGGFGGLYAAKELGGAPVRVTLLDRRNYHLFQPLLYQVATAMLSPGDIAEPLRYILRRDKNIQVLLAEAAGVDVANRRVRLTDGEVPYDYLILATGATHSYFGHPEWSARAPGLKTLEDAIKIRARFLDAFERAEREADEGRRQALLTFVIIGGGPTGVELAGTMSEIARRFFPPEFRRIDAKTTRILLLEGGPRVLPVYPESLSASALRQLEKLGVEVRTRALVTAIEPGAVHVGSETISTENIFWAAGVAASPLGASLGVAMDRFGRVPVEPDLSLPGHPEVFVVGDLAAVKDAEGKIVPGVAPAAMHMGRHAARMILRDQRGRPRVPFVYRDRGSLATIGRAAAVADLKRFHLSGLSAWLAWLFVHIFFLIGFQNRLFVLAQWAWAYLGFNPSTRLITYYEGGRRRATDPGPK